MPSPSAPVTLVTRDVALDTAVVADTAVVTLSR
eukprot:CAMPEP_0175956272 /NCGR_PEP_ID=MMETSP0108-20121206/32984_1 /TAXON_ID=195067 ORGANISM="Goniomonas pacifica, Strain CCMP1869" /NCGR_SAMPLE_ID=MMETSP0108 /ASSEMBLY_ACC=CAM_ASM_000204 /LENGTH=32 /DNA_ID= /DNA_START= /DNA_END= /DNA_ORIENTATION=